MRKHFALVIAAIALLFRFSIEAQTAGSLDTSFDSRISAGYVSAISLQPDGKVIIAGDFTLSNGARARVARLNPDGGVDTGFKSVIANNEILALALQADGKVLIAGRFTSVNDSPRNYIARLNQDGAVDTEFNTGTGPNVYVATVALQADGKILIGGAFDQINGATRTALGRLNSNGALDSTFAPKLDAGVFVSLITVSSDKIVVAEFAGSATTINRFDTDGSQDKKSTSALIDGEVLSMARQTDGNLMIAGSFQKIGSTLRNRIARLNASGTVDLSFDPGTGPNGNILAVAIQTDGKVVVGGNFEQFNGTPRAGVARLFPNGALDTTYNQARGVEGSVTSLALQPDGKLLVGGFISNVDNVPRNGVARLLGDVTEVPTRPQLSSPTKTENTFSVSFPTITGKSYGLEFAETAGGAFSAVGAAIQGDGSTKSLVDNTASTAFRFYRVRIE